MNSKFKVENLKRFWKLKFSCWCLFGICFWEFGILNCAQAQFFKGIGITGGVTMAREKWFDTYPDGTTDKLRKKNIFGFNGSLRAEFIDNDNIRWVTEFQFNQKGCKDKTDSATYKDKLNYICWNNFLKLQYETFDGYPYLLLGPRVEYLLTQATKSPAITGAFQKFNFSWGAGIGYEKIVYEYFKPFVELHYNPDTPFYYAYKTEPLKIRNRAWELRIGIIFRPGGHDSCPAVIY
ncbi:MAG: hypothetical protein HY063_10665 [Bacteroidetes bacterium]|nr:hypothetical protein [Bacteroidota bacterium]